MSNCCFFFFLSVFWPHLDLIWMLFGCERMRLNWIRLLVLETLMRFYHAGSPALLYGWTFLGCCVILRVLKVGSQYKPNTEVMETYKVWVALKTHRGDKQLWMKACWRLRTPPTSSEVKRTQTRPKSESAPSLPYVSECKVYRILGIYFSVLLCDW